MNRLKLAGFLGTALALAACGGGDGNDTVDAGADTSQESATPAADGSTATDATSGTVATDDAATFDTSTAPAGAAAVAAAPAAFAQCKACHSVKPGDHGIGPSLAGIFGTRAGDIAGFEFSSPMKDSGIVWNEANLDAFLLDPRGVIPGTKMTFAGLKDEAKRKEVIAYMKSL